MKHLKKVKKHADSIKANIEDKEHVSKQLEEMEKVVKEELHAQKLLDKHMDKLVQEMHEEEQIEHKYAKDIMELSALVDLVRMLSERDELNTKEFEHVHEKIDKIAARLSKEFKSSRALDNKIKALVKKAESYS